jgi:predicted metal-dependent HD superfamily phosphohydrolase
MPESPIEIPSPLADDLKRRYAEPQRAYHDWSHIEALLALLPDLLPKLNDPAAVYLAVLFHDAIYDPRAADNEERSARLLAEQMAGLVSPAMLDRAVRLVLATRAHAVPDDVAAAEAADMTLFLDMDLAILGADPDSFDRYEAQVRREYAHVSDEAFAKGRAAILTRFAARPALYYSDWGRQRFEAQARLNITRSLACLERG